MVEQLDVEPVREQLGVGAGLGERVTVTIRGEKPGDFTVAAAAQGDEAVGVAGESFPGHRLKIVFGSAEQSAEVGVAGVGGGEEDEVKPVRQFDLAAGDRLESGLPALLRELDRAGNRVLVGQGKRFHLLRHRRRHEVVDPAGGVEQAVVAVVVEGGVGGGGHGVME